MYNHHALRGGGGGGEGKVSGGHAETAASKAEEIGGGIELTESEEDMGACSPDPSDKTLESVLKSEAEQVGDAQSLRDYADFLQTTNKDLANARTLYTRALQLQPSCVRTHCSFGRLLHDAGQLDGAERHYRVSAPLLRLATHALHMPYTCPHSNLHSETTCAPKDMQDRYASKRKLARAALQHWCVWPRTITKLHNKKHVHSNFEADNTRSG